MPDKIKKAALFPAVAASAICGLTLYALGKTLDYLFRDVEENKKKKNAKEGEV